MSNNTARAIDSEKAVQIATDALVSGRTFKDRRCKRAKLYAAETPEKETTLVAPPWFIKCWATPSIHGMPKAVLARDYTQHEAERLLARHPALWKLTTHLQLASAQAHRVHPFLTLASLFS